MTLSVDTGIISGTPISAGDFDFAVGVTSTQIAPPQQFTVGVANSQIASPLTASKQLRLKVNPKGNQTSLVISTTTLPSGTVQVPYTAALAATGGTQPYSWSVIAGSLPPGLALGGSIGAVAGTPSASGQYSFTVQVTDSATRSQNATTALTLTISPPPAVSVSISPITATVGSGGTQQFTATVLNAANTGVVWSIAGGGTISPSGLYTAPAVTANAMATVTATSVADATKSASATVAITVASTKIATSLTLVPNVNPVNQGAWVSLTAHVAYAGSSRPTGLITISEGSTVWNGGLTPVLDETWWTNILPAGSHSLVAKYSGDANYAASVSPVQVLSVAALAPSPLQITTSSLPGGALGVNYSATLVAANGVPPYTWSTIGGLLPPGLALQASTGQISGSPTQAGAFGFLVQVKDSSAQVASSNFSVVIAPLPPPTVGGISPNSGPVVGGTSVTISGTNFQAGASVLFGGVAASSVTASGATQIQAVTPAHTAGAVDVIVQNPDGQSSRLSSGFVYNSLPPTVSGVSPNTGPAAGGTSVSITGANFLAGALVLFGTAPASGVTVNSATQIQAVTAASTAGAVDVTVQNPDGQSGKLASGFTYTAPPVGNPIITSVSPNSGPSGTQVIINGTNFASGATVAFGGMSATSKVLVSATQLSASVPSIGTGVVDVKVTNPGGASATLAGGFTVTTPQSLLAGMTPNAFSLPSGWTTVATQDFEGALPSSQAIQKGTIVTSNSHTGSKSLFYNITGEAIPALWELNPGNTGAFSDLYISYHEYLSSGAVIFSGSYGQFLISSVHKDLGGGIYQDWGTQRFGGVDTGTTPAAQTTFVLDIEPQATVQGSDYNIYGVSSSFSNPWPIITNQWVQWEVWYHPNSLSAPSCIDTVCPPSDGFIRMYMNGKLMFHIENANINGPDDMSNAYIVTSSYYGVCGTPPCSSAGVNFNMWVDDIIVMKK